MPNELDFEWLVIYRISLIFGKVGGLYKLWLVPYLKSYKELVKKLAGDSIYNLSCTFIPTSLSW